MDPKNLEPVHNFTNELFSLYDHKIPISKAKMAAITKLAMKAIKFYKHVVQNVEKFILKCKPEYKIPGLYVIDSIVRQSRHQFGPEKDVFAPRFARNMEDTFAHLFRCSQEDKSKIIRVLNLWQKNNVFAPEVIQPLFDLANPDHPVHQAFMQQQPSGQVDMSNGMKRDSPTQKEEGAPETLSTANVQKFQQLLLQQSASMDNSGMDSMKFAPLMDYNDHGSDYDDDKVEPLPAANLMHFNNFNNFSKFLGDPNITKQLENIKQMDVQRYLNDIPSGASGSLIDPLQQQQQHQGSGITLANINSLRGPPPQDNKDQDVEFIADFSVPEVIPINSRSPTPTRHKRRKSRTRSRSRDRGRYRRRRSRSRSRSRSYSRSPRNKRRSSRERAREKEREAEKERRRKGLPDIKKDHLSVCSTTLWVGHLSKLVQQEELSDTFGKYGDIISIDMIPPRGCAYIVMNRRQDAYKAMQSLKNHKMQNRTITISWAAGKGVKSKEWKDYFDQTLGVTYIPFSKLAPTTDFVVLEEGGMYDDETMPIWVKEKLKQPPTQTLVNKDTIFPQFFPQSIDTSQPPPNASMLPAMPPFSLGARPLLVPTQGMLGLGVPPPNMLMPGMIFPTPGDLKIPPGLMGFSLPTANQQQVLSSAQVPQQPPNDDQMDIEMDDESSSSKNDGNNIGMAQGYFNQPPPMNIQNLIMQNQLQNEQQNDSNDFNNRMSGNRNNRSQSRERDNRDFRSRGPRDRNDRRSNDFNRNQRWSNDTNGDRNRSRGGDDSQNNFNRRHQQDIPSLLSQPMPLMDDPINSRQRNNDFGRDEFVDRRGGFQNRGSFQQRGGRGNRGGQFNNRGGMRGFHNNSFNNDRQGGNFHDSNRRGGRNWREDDDRRNFSRGNGNNYDRKSNNRWNDRNENWDENENSHQQQQQPSQDQDYDDSQENCEIIDNNSQHQNDDNLNSNENEHEHNETTNIDDYSNQNDRNDIQDDEGNGRNENENDDIRFNQGDNNNDEVNTGNTTPLCDENEARE